MTPATKKLLLMGVALEVAIFAFCFFTVDDLPQVFKLSARYSGRVSALVFGASGVHTDTAVSM